LFCLVATESEANLHIINNLKKVFTEWDFKSASNVKELKGYSGDDQIDVVVVSRFLSGDSWKQITPNLKLMFSYSEIVLLAGTENEEQQSYIKFANKHGLDKIVTGKLPGDRPNTIIAVLKEIEKNKKHRNDSAEENNGLSFENDWTVNDSSKDFDSFNIETEADSETEDHPSNPSETGIEDVLDAVLDGKDKGKDEILNKLTQLMEALESNNESSSMERTTPLSMGKRGVFVVSTANKGGVGKTTVAVTLAAALSKAGVPVAIMDYDMEGPDVTTMMGIKGVEGIERLTDTPIRPNVLQDLIVEKNGLSVLPGPMNKTIPNFKKGQLAKIAEVMTEMYPIVICDTPPGYWTKPWLTEIFNKSDLVLAVVDQSVLSQQETKDFAPYLLSMGVNPEKISIVLNRYSSKLHNPRTVEKQFCAGFKKSVKTRPRVVAVIPEDWTSHVKQGYKGQVTGLNDAYSQWHKLAEDIAVMAGYQYRSSNKAPFNFKDKLLKKFKKA